MDMIGKQKALADRIECLLDGSGALLAGGAPRDWYIGKEASDLDFYINEDDVEVRVMMISDLLDIELFKKGDEKYESFIEDTNELLAVYEGDFHGEVVQFMFISIDPLEFVTKKFDLSICKVWYTKGNIEMDWEARLSFEHKVAVLYEDLGRHVDKVFERDEWINYRLCTNWKRALGVIEQRNMVPDIAPGLEPGMLFIDEAPQAMVDF